VNRQKARDHLEEESTQRKLSQKKKKNARFSPSNRISLPGLGIPDSRRSLVTQLNDCTQRFSTTRPFYGLFDMTIGEKRGLYPLLLWMCGGAPRGGNCTCSLLVGSLSLAFSCVGGCIGACDEVVCCVLRQEDWIVHALRLRGHVGNALVVTSIRGGFSRRSVGPARRPVHQHIQQPPFQNSLAHAKRRILLSFALARFARK
jgi:hypothetical protein